MVDKPLASAADQEAEGVKTALRKEADKLAAAAGSLSDDAATFSREAAETGKAKILDRLEGVISSLQAAAGDLQQRDDKLAGAVEAAAGRLESLVQHLDDQDIAGLAEEARELARRRPALFLGGAVALGFAMSRAAKASASSASRANGYYAEAAGDADAL